MERHSLTGLFKNDISLDNCHVQINGLAKHIICSNCNVNVLGIVYNIQECSSANGTAAQNPVAASLDTGTRPEVKGLVRTVYVRDKVAEKELQRQTLRVKELEREVCRLKAEVASLDAKNNELDSALMTYKTGGHFPLSKHNSIVADLKDRIAAMKQRIEDLSDVNRQQADRIHDLESKREAAPADEYEPNRNDIKMMTRNLHLFIGDYFDE